MNRCNAAGLEIIRQGEGLRLIAYKCPAGVWTIGYGHTKGVCQGLTCTPEQADAWLREDLASAEEAVQRLITVRLNDNQFSALCSFAFNVGSGALSRSTLRRVLNEGDYGAVSAQLARWVKAGGKTLRGLVRRRAAEAALWETP